MIKSKTNLPNTLSPRFGTHPEHINFNNRTELKRTQTFAININLKAAAISLMRFRFSFLIKESNPGITFLYRPHKPPLMQRSRTGNPTAGIGPDRSQLENSPICPGQFAYVRKYQRDGVHFHQFPNGRRWYPCRCGRDAGVGVGVGGGDGETVLCYIPFARTRF